MFSPCPPWLSLLTGLAAADFGQELRINIAAADHGDVVSGARQFSGTEHESGDTDRAARFGHGFRIHTEGTRRLANLVFFDVDDVIDVGPNVLEIDLAHTLGA